MRKILLGLLAIILLAFAVYMAIYGASIAGVEIKGVSAIDQENEKLEKQIEEVSKLKNKTYSQNVQLLDASYRKLISEKENYEKVLALGVDENGQPLSKIQEYEMERIWVIVGNYAKKHGVKLKIEVASNNTVSKTYDLTFSAIGGYIQITDFLQDFERDSSLVFKMENFKMKPNTTDSELIATFVCKDIKLNISDVNQQVNYDNLENSAQNTNTTGNTTTGNTTNSSGTGNTTISNSNTTGGNTTSNTNTTNTSNTTTNNTTSSNTTN